MALKECLINSKLTTEDVVDSYISKVDKLVGDGRLLQEAEAIVKNEFINDQYKKLNTELNSIKSQLKIAPSAPKILTLPDLAPIDK